MSNISRLSKIMDKKIVQIDTINNNQHHLEIKWEWVSYFSNNWETLILDWELEIKSRNVTTNIEKFSTRVTDIVCWRNDSYMVICKHIESEWKRIINHINLILSVEHGINQDVLNKVDRLRAKRKLNHDEEIELEKLEQELSADNIEIKEKYLLQRNLNRNHEWEIVLF